MNSVQPEPQWWPEYVDRVNAACDRLGLQKDGTHVHPVAARAAREHDGAGKTGMMEDGTMDARAVVEQAGLQRVAADPAKAVRTAQALILLAGAMGDQASSLKDEGEYEAAMQAEQACLTFSDRAQALAEIADSPRDFERAGVLASTSLHEMGRDSDALARLEEVGEALEAQGLTRGRAWRSERKLVVDSMQGVEV